MLLEGRTAENREFTTYSVGICEVPGVSEPAAQVVVRASSGDVIDHQSSGRSSVVAPSDRSEERAGRETHNSAVYIQFLHVDT
jgi:hypothetical protein